MEKATKTGRVTRTIDRLKLFFLGLFAFITAATLIVHFVWIWPGKECEAAHKWWDWRTRVCAQPILISDVTGRIIADPKARAEAKKALGRDPNGPDRSLLVLPPPPKAETAPAKP